MKNDNWKNTAVILKIKQNQFQNGDTIKDKKNTKT